MDPNPQGDMAPVTRIALVVTLLLISCSAATAAVLHDPWLARLQVGEFRDPADIPLDEAGWPTDLLAPLMVDPGWLAGAPSIASSTGLPRDSRQTTWRLALPGLGSAELAERFHDRARRHARQIVAMAAPGADPGPVIDDLLGPWGGQAARLRASRLWEAGRWPEAAAACERILSAAGRLALDPSEVFVWTLRRERCRAAEQRRPDFARIWSVLDDLGPYDTRSGWAVWLTLRRARDLAPLPPDSGEIAGRILTAAGKLWLSADELRDARLPAAVEAGVGALLLAKQDLPAHFERHPEPPQQVRHQTAWLRGQRRLEGSAATVERLAGLRLLDPGLRLDLWRRASERRLLAGQWEAGLENLERSLALVGSAPSSGWTRRAREWAVQALALAVARDRDTDARAIVDLAEAHLGASDRAAWRLDAAHLLRRLGMTAPDGQGARAAIEARIRAGEAPPVNSRDGIVWPDPTAWRDRMWRSWSRWGLALIGDPDRLVTGDRAYRDGLMAVRDADGAAQRHALGCSVAANRIRGTRIVEPLLAFALQRDLERAAAGQAVPATSPIDRLRPPAPWRERSVQLRWHAVMGLALALGDERGILSVAVRLPAAGVAFDDVRRFWYPVPADPAVRAALDASGLPVELLLGIARNESLFEPAIRSRAGALGYMQIMPFHYDEPAGPPGDAHWSHPVTSIEAASRILSSEVRAADGGPYRAVAAYNAGRGAVQRWEKQLGRGASRDLFWAWIGYPETRGYTFRVLRDREVYRELLGGAP